MALKALWLGIFGKLQREFSEDRPEMMDLPGHDENELRRDLENLGHINRTFGGRRAVAKTFHLLAGNRASITLIDLASGYGDHGRNLIKQARARGQEVTVVAVDQQFQTLQIARQATAPGQNLFYVQALSAPSSKTA